MSGLYEKFFVFKREQGGPLACTPPAFHFEGRPVAGCFVLRPEKDPAARAAIRAYAVQTPDDDLRHDLLEWMKTAGPPEESELRTVSMCVLWLTWHHAEMSHDWGRQLWTIKVPIFKKPPGYRSEIVRYEVAERENFVDAVYDLGRRLGTGAGSFSELVEVDGKLVAGAWPRG